MKAWVKVPNLCVRGESRAAHAIAHAGNTLPTFPRGFWSQRSSDLKRYPTQGENVSLCWHFIFTPYYSSRTMVYSK